MSTKVHQFQGCVKSRQIASQSRKTALQLDLADRFTHPGLPLSLCRGRGIGSRLVAGGVVTSSKSVATRPVAALGASRRNNDCDHLVRICWQPPVATSSSVAALSARSATRRSASACEIFASFSYRNSSRLLQRSGRRRPPARHRLPRHLDPDLRAACRLCPKANEVFLAIGNGGTVSYVNVNANGHVETFEEKLIQLDDITWRAGQ